MRRLGLVLGGVMIALAGCGDDGDASTSTTTTEAPTTSTLPEAIEDVVELGGDVFGVEVHGNRLWVESGSAGQQALSVVDARSSEVIDTLEACCPTVIGDDLWVGVGSDLVRANPRTGAEIERLPGVGGHVCATDEALWTLEGTEEQGEVVRRGRPGYAVEARIPLPEGEAKDVGCFAGAVWVPIDGANVLVRIDPTSNGVSASVPAGLRPHSLAFEADDVWVIDHGWQQVLRVDGQTAEVEATIKGPGENVGIVAQTNPPEATTRDGIAKIDPSTNAIVSTIDLGFGSYYDIAVADGSLWVTTEDQGQLLRVAMT